MGNISKVGAPRSSILPLRNSPNRIRSGGLCGSPILGTLRRVDEIYFQKLLPKNRELTSPISRRLGPEATSDRAQWVRNQGVHPTIITHTAPARRSRTLISTRSGDFATRSAKSTRWTPQDAPTAADILRRDEQSIAQRSDESDCWSTRNIFQIPHA